MGRKRFRAQHCPASPWVFCDKEGDRVQSVKRSYATACRKAGIEDFRIHDLRHTCAAWLVTAGVPLTEVRDLLGHSTVKMTERYAHLAPENVRAAVTLLEGHESRLSHVGN
jgi:integrase